MSFSFVVHEVVYTNTNIMLFMHNFQITEILKAFFGRIQVAKLIFSRFYLTSETF